MYRGERIEKLGPRTDATCQRSSMLIVPHMTRRILSSFRRDGARSCGSEVARGTRLMETSVIRVQFLCASNYPSSPAILDRVDPSGISLARETGRERGRRTDGSGKRERKKVGLCYRDLCGTREPAEKRREKQKYRQGRARLISRFNYFLN